MVSLIIYLVIYVEKPFPVKFSRRDLRPNRSLLLRLYGIGVPAILNLALPSLLISALNGILAAYSSCYVLVLGIYYKLQTFLYLPASGIVQGLRPLISIGFLVSSVSVTACGAFEGVGMGMSSLVISLCRYLIVILPAAWILSHILGPVGVWHGFWISEWISAVVSGCLVVRFAAICRAKH